MGTKNQHGGPRTPGPGKTLGRNKLLAHLRRVRCGDITLPKWLHTQLMTQSEPAGRIIERWAIENGYNPPQT